MLLITILLAAGMLLLFSEIFLPGMVAGTLGFIAMGIAVFLGFRDYGVVSGSILLLLVFLYVTAGLIYWMIWLPRSRFSQAFVSRSTIGEIGTDRPDLVGMEGFALTPLRPSGAVLLGDRQVDAVSEGDLIDRDERVRVVEVEGLRVVVRRI